MLRTIPTILAVAILATCLSAQDSRPGEPGFAFTASPIPRATETPRAAGLMDGPGAHDLVPGVLEEVARVCSQRFGVELSLLPAGTLDSTSSATLDAAQTERLLAVAKPLATIRTRVAPWAETMIEAVTQAHAVETRVYRPLTDAISPGTRASIRIDPVPGGGIVVTLRGQQSELVEPIRLLAARDTSDLVLELPSVTWAATSASARIESGGALVVGTDAVGRAAWLVRVFSPPRAEPSRGPSVHLIPIAGAVLRLRSPNPSFQARYGSAEGTEEPDLGPVVRMSPESLLERIRSLAVGQPPPAGDLAATCVGPFIAVSGTKDMVQRAAAEVGKILAEATSRFDYELRSGTVLASEWKAPADSEGLDQLAGTLSERASTAGIVGDRVVLLAGKSQAYLADWDVEISGGRAFLADPIVDQLFTGSSASLCGGRGAPGRCLLEARLEHRELLSLKPTRTTLDPLGSITFEVPEIAAATARVSADVPLGSWTLLHSAPLQGTGRQVVVMVRVREG